jgi:hypothetical protein
LTVDLVLSCGAKLCLRQREDGQLSVLTCYFISDVRTKPAPRRWRWLARALILRYAADNGNGTYSPPNRTAWPREVESGEWVSSPRFLTASRWGLDRPLGEPWFAIPDFVPAAPPGPTATALGRRPDY